MSVIEFLRIARAMGLSLRRLVYVVVLSICVTLVESAGVLMVIPVYDYIAQQKNVSALMEKGYWQLIHQTAEMLGIKVSLAFLLSAIFCFLLVRQCLSLIRSMSVAALREDFIRSVRLRIFDSYLSTSLFRQESEAKGEIVNGLTLELQRISVTLSGLVSIANAIVLAVIYGALLLWTSWQMTLAAAVIMTVGLMPVRLLWRDTSAAGRAATLANTDMSRFLIERLMSVRLVRLSGTETAERTAIRSYAKRQRDAVMRVERLLSFVSVAIEPIILGMVFILLFLAVEVFSVSSDQLALFLLVVLRLLPVVRDVMKGHQLVLSSAGSAENISRRLATLRADRELDTGEKSLASIERGIEMIGVSYKYPQAEHFALSDVNLFLPAGSYTAIVGPSGAGKSTLIDLLPRLRQCTSGLVLIDDAALDEYQLGSLRAQIAYVPQSPQIFDGSPTDHIRLGKHDANIDEVVDAARLAGAYDFIAALPHGFDTPLGECAFRLSGGQRQRLDLARAIVRRGALLVLDEPTSSLDAEAEVSFVETLNTIRRNLGITIVVVAHRLTTIVQASQIVLLKDGMVEAVGSHSELLKCSSWYASAHKNYASFAARHDTRQDNVVSDDIPPYRGGRNANAGGK